MSRALVVTVGTGTRAPGAIVSPLVKTIEESGAGRVMFLATDESARYADEIAALLSEVQASTYALQDGENVEQVYLDALEALRDLRAEGFSPDEIDIDFTSGLKSMSAGAVLAGLSFRVNQLRYVTGEREGGIVKDGAETFLVLSPWRVLARADLDLALDLTVRLQFSAARTVLDGIPRKTGSAYDESLKRDLGRVASAFDAWDRFRHKGFKHDYESAFKARQRQPWIAELEKFRVADDVVKRVADLHTVTNSSDPRQRFSLDLTADLWDNAQRRWVEGKYDDAVARWYRCAEALSQHVLATEYGIDTDRVDPDLVTPATRRQLAQMDRPQLALRAGYGELRDRGHPLGHAFFAQPLPIDLRNKSILAHGTQPIDRAVAGSFAEAVTRLGEAVDPGFRVRCASLQFPWVDGGA